MWDFPGDLVVKNLPASARDTGLIPVPGRFHVPWSNKARVPNYWHLCAKSLCPPREAAVMRSHTLQWRGAPTDCNDGRWNVFCNISKQGCNSPEPILAFECEWRARKREHKAYDPTDAATPRQWWLRGSGVAETVRNQKDRMLAPESWDAYERDDLSNPCLLHLCIPTRALNSLMWYLWKWKSLSCVWHFATPLTIRSMGFSRPEYWTG